MRISAFDRLVHSRLLLTILSAAAALVISPVGITQETEELTITVSECVELESALERFECYERLVEEAQARNEATDLNKDSLENSDSETQRAPDVTASSQAEPAQNSPRTTTAVDTFGFPDDSRNRREIELPPEIRSTVVVLDNSRANRLAITLDNGQTWQQTQSRRYNLRVGHKVRIYGTHWGSAYRLAADELSGFIQVNRIR